MMKIWIDGEIAAPGAARVSVLDHGLLYGDGVFEGLRCVDGRVVDWEHHARRLELSCRAVYLEPPPEPRLWQAVSETCVALGDASCYLRLIVTRGEGALGVDVASCRAPSLICIAGQIALYGAREPALVTVSWRRPTCDVLDTRVKSLNYLNNVLAKLEARRHGADEALVLNTQGQVAEASAANVFAVIDSELVTPPATDGALEGITRRRVLLLARSAGYRAVERSMTRYDLLRAEEVFLTGSGAGIVGVAQLDGIALGQSRAVSDELRRAARVYAREHGRAIEGLLASKSYAAAAVAS